MPCPALKAYLVKSLPPWFYFAGNKLRRPSMLAKAIPKRATAEPPSGTVPVAAEKENCAFAAGFCVVKCQTPGVDAKPCPEIVPVPSTVTEFEFGWAAMAEPIRSNTNPSTAQKLEIAPELKDHGA